MSTHVLGFQLFSLGFLHFVLALLATSSMRVSIIGLKASWCAPSNCVSSQKLCDNLYDTLCMPVCLLALASTSQSIHIHSYSQI